SLTVAGRDAHRNRDEAGGNGLAIGADGDADRNRVVAGIADLAEQDTALDAHLDAHHIAFLAAFPGEIVDRCLVGDTAGAARVTGPVRGGSIENARGGAAEIAHLFLLLRQLRAA
ncbi:MAG: hypothetical protein ACK55I_30100, partial [bacterium]